MNRERPGREGRFVRQSTGYRAFVPAPLSPHPPVDMAALLEGFEEAVTEIGRLDGVSEVLPNPELFVAMYVRKEAVLSSQIEGTQSSLEDVLEFEAGAEPAGLPKDVNEVFDYVRALNHGLARLADLPLSLRLLREIHAILLENARGSQRSPGKSRRTQNWIGPAGASLAEAVFVPPPPQEMRDSLANLERYLHDGTPDLVACGVAHCQFETIHPFLDANGRLGRLLVTLMLCERRVLGQPLLYLSHYLRARRQEYYDRLMAVRTEGDWEGWLRFFLAGVAEVAREATGTAREINRLRDRDRETIGARIRGRHRHALHDLLFEHPYVTTRFVERRLDVAYGTARQLIERFAEAGLLEETTGRARGQRYRYREYVEQFS